jgi:glycerol-3-phosphate acyltransferase PlsY
MVIKRHTANIRRLVAGTELRFGAPKPATAGAGETEAPPEPPAP